MDNLDYNLSSIQNKKLEIYFISTQSYETFEVATGSAFNKTLIKLEKLRQKIEKKEKKISNYIETGTNPTDKDRIIYDEIESLYFVQMYELDNINAMSEMKIIYIFKSLENRIKSMITYVYPNTELKEFYKWETLMGFLKNVGIKVQDINGYTEVDELRKVNNCIKHDGQISEAIKKITEFKNEYVFDYNSLEIFQKRIISKVELFSKKLGEEILLERFDFTDGKLDKIVEELKSRMDEITIKKLANRLL